MQRNVRNTMSVSRRSFLQTAGIAAAGYAIVSLGTTNKALANEANGTAEGVMGGVAAVVDSVAFDEECDVLVVGAGIAGLSAAITLTREAPEKKVVLVEKGASPAGCSPVCAGDFLFGTTDEPYPVQYLKDMATTALGQTIPDDVLEAFATGIDENLP